MMQLLYTNYDNSGCQIYYSYTYIFIFMHCVIAWVALFAAFNTYFNGSHFTQESVLASLIDDSVLLTLLHQGRS